MNKILLIVLSIFTIVGCEESTKYTGNNITENVLAERDVVYDDKGNKIFWTIGNDIYTHNWVDYNNDSTVYVCCWTRVTTDSLLSWLLVNMSDTLFRIEDYGRLMDDPETGKKAWSVYYTKDGTMYSKPRPKSQSNELELLDYLK